MFKKIFVNIGKEEYKTLINRLCIIYRISESQILLNYKLVEKYLYFLFGKGANIIIRSIKKELIESFSFSCNPSKTNEEIISKIWNKKIDEFINKNNHSHDHIELLYENEASKQNNLLK